MKIVHISAECYPIAKVGGLADVVGALPKYQQEAGHDVKVIMPCYKTRFWIENDFESVYSATVKLGNFDFDFNVFKEKTNKLGFELYVVEIPELFDRQDIYGYHDDIERFLSFQIATLDWLNTLDQLPDVINCHDHHTALIPFMALYAHKYQKFKTVKTAITIHNGLYQGQFGFDKLHYLPEFNLEHIGVLEWGNCINSLAAGIKCAGAVSTVSPSYLNEINTYSNGLESLFNSVRYKSKGILNGIDTDVWNPATDTMLEKKYNLRTNKKGKQDNKEKLCKLYDLDPTKPLFSFIGRLWTEKGGDLLPESIVKSFESNPQAMNFFILGSGKLEIEQDLKNLLAQYKGNYNVNIGYNEELAHLIYAAADFLLMPSRVEPCGLNQMYSLRYGTVPIVRRTGGLRDTVVDFGDGGNGICHDQASVADICHSVNRALDLYKDKSSFSKIRKKGMETDNSWSRVSQEYVEMYNLI
jgi:starch synthase